MSTTTEWHLVLTMDDPLRAQIVGGRLEAAGIPVVIVPKRSSSYTFAAGGRQELWVPLELAHRAILLLDEDPDDAPRHPGYPHDGAD